MNKRQLLYFLALPSLFMVLGLSMGCKQKSAIQAQIRAQAPEGLIVSSWSIASGRLEGHFNADGQEASLSCSVSVQGTLDGEPFTRTYNATVTAKGCKCDNYKLKCQDPLAIQFPSDAHNFAGTFDDGVSSAGPLNIVSGLAKVAVSPGKNLYAEDGHQIVLIDLPPDIPDGDYAFALTFNLAMSRAIAVKPIILAEVSFDSDTVLPNVLPNTTSFEDITALIIPVSDELMDITIPLDGVQANDPLTVCPIADQLHVVGEESNQIPVGLTAFLFASVQNQFASVADVDVVFRRVIGDFSFTEGNLSPDGQTTTVTTNEFGDATAEFAPSGTGLSLINVTVPDTELSAFYVFFGQ